MFYHAWAHSRSLSHAAGAPQRQSCSQVPSASQQHPRNGQGGGGGNYKKNKLHVALLEGKERHLV